MIEYEKAGSQTIGIFRDLTRIHGSAVYKVVLPATISTLILYGLHELDLVLIQDSTIFVIYHPYAIGAFIAFFSLLLTFRLNFSYGRYMEGATAVHQMSSKWLDVASCVSAFHYQQESLYAEIRPPTYASLGDNIDPRRIRNRHRTYRHINDFPISPRAVGNQNFSRRRQDVASTVHSYEGKGKSINSPDDGPDTRLRHDPKDMKIPIPMRFQEQFFAGTEPELSFREGEAPAQQRARLLVKQARASRNVTLRAKLPRPSLFLQETAHLLSLLSAVAMSTLRNDIDKAESPVVPYVPGQSWPCVDPDRLEADIMKEYGESNAFWRILYFCLGLSRSDKRRTLYNAARPFGVLGGVSDEEILMLQAARGPYAKVMLVSGWLQEFISRESLAGSLGNVAPPILSRLYQFISDGTVGYNQARKVAYVPFPFPTSQITAVFSVAIMFIFPFLYGAFVTRFWFSCFLNFLTVLCFLGLHEVSRELEDPFSNVPNDIPLLTFQAQFNEALVTMYAGFHPDSWWDVESEDDEETGSDTIL